MKLADARKHYYVFSGKLSDVSRQLCFAGIAVVWVFVTASTEGLYTIPEGLLFPITCFIIGLASDLLHYIVAAASWGIFHRLVERSGTSESSDFGAPRWINYAPLFFFWGKVAATAIGYWALFSEVTK